MWIRLVPLAVSIAGLAAALLAWQLTRTGIHQGYGPEQPIAFSHKVHAGDNRIPCLYCHYAARLSRHAGIPPLSVCMNCHSMLEKQTVDIEKLKESVQQKRPVRWIKVHSLPDYVYFNHSQHVLSGVACQQCHGEVEKMERVEQVAPLTMGWCLRCHRENAHVETSAFKRVMQNLGDRPAPSAGQDCASCHY
jgi:hypothetical protein